MMDDVPTLILGPLQQYVYESEDYEFATDRVEELLTVLRITMSTGPEASIDEARSRVVNWPESMSVVREAVLSWLAIELLSVDAWRTLVWAAFEAVSEFEGQLLDYEKLLGHMIIHHQLPSDSEIPDFDTLLREHRSVHLQ